MPPEGVGDARLSRVDIGERLPIQQGQLEQFCRRHHIREMALFGSVLRDDFHAGSDIDLLVSFDPNAHHSLLGHVQMEHELAGLLGRDVDLVEREALENPFVRHQILNNLVVIYATGHA